jgi:hypothetical protein
MVQLLRQNNAFLRKIADDVNSLRAADPAVNAPESVFRGTYLSRQYLRAFRR